MKTTLENHKDNLLSKKNVVGVGLGNKWQNNQNLHRQSLLIFVSKKESLKQLNPKDVIPSQIDGLETDVVGKTGTIQSQALSKKERPVKAGFSCGHIHVTAGTMGGWFIDKDGDIVGLSNNHVLANENRAHTLLEDGYAGHWTIQPGIYDNKNWRNNKLGHLKDFVKLRKRGNVQDSAICKVDHIDLINPEIHEIGVPSGFNDSIKTDEQVQKSGRTTQYTTGKVIATDATVNVQYDNGVFQFDNQIITTAMSQGGDSGSLLLDMNRKIVGLLFAGSSTVTIHNKIEYPRKKWGLKIYDPNPIEETISYRLIADNKEITSGNSMPDLNNLMKKCREFAKDGKPALIRFEYETKQSD